MNELLHILKSAAAAGKTITLAGATCSCCGATNCSLCSLAGLTFSFDTTLPNDFPFAGSNYSNVHVAYPLPPFSGPSAGCNQFAANGSPTEGGVDILPGGGGPGVMGLFFGCGNGTCFRSDSHATVATGDPPNGSFYINVFFHNDSLEGFRQEAPSTILAFTCSPFMVLFSVSVANTDPMSIYFGLTFTFNILVTGA